MAVAADISGSAVLKAGGGEVANDLVCENEPSSGQSDTLEQQKSSWEPILLFV